MVPELKEKPTAQVRCRRTALPSGGEDTALPLGASLIWVAMPSSLLQVECYAGYRADERPERFRFVAAPEKTFEVKEVLDQWYGVGYRCFRVRADDQNLYVLRHHEGDDIWTLDSFRRSESLP